MKMTGDDEATYEFMVIMDKFCLCVEQTVSTAAAIGLAAREGVNMIRKLSNRSLLGDKMNLSVRLGKLFYESSTGVPALLPCSPLPRQARGTIRKMLT